MHSEYLLTYIINLYYTSAGKGAGSLIGGYLMNAFGTRPTYRIFAVVMLITGVIYFIFNATYLRKRSLIEGNDIVKKKPRSTDDNCGKQNTNDISLHEKPLDEIDRDKGHSLENMDNGVDNEGFLNESRERKLSIGANEQSFTQTDVEAMENARNIGKTEGASREHEEREDKLRRKSDVIHRKTQGNNMQENSFANLSFESDEPKQRELIVEKK